MTPEKYKTLKGVKKQENKLTEVEEIETTALATIEANSTATSLKVNNSMWPYVSECSLSDDEEEIFFYLRSCTSRPQTKSQSVKVSFMRVEILQFVKK